MKEKYDDLVVDKLYELYKTYENYIWKNKNSNLIVLFQKKQTISFYLYENREVIDELDISFDQKEDKLFKAISLKTFANLLGNTYIYKDKNIYYNKTHKPYLRIIVGDPSLDEIITQLVDNQEKEIINKNNKIIKDNALIKRKRYSKEFLQDMDKRIELSKLMLRGW